MTKFCVKKPFFVVVAVIIVLIIGGVSLSRMQTDLLPDISMNYLAVVTTEPGASAEQVKLDIAKPMENALGTLNGVTKIRSTSADNYCLVMLEYDDDQDMNAALVRVTNALGSLSLPEMCSKPTVMELGVDMLATMYVTVDYEGKDIKEVTAFTDDEIIPYIERQPGVASVVAQGMVEETIEIRLNQDKIDEVNDKIVELTNDKLKDAKKEITDAEKDLDKALDKIEKQQKKLDKKQEDTNKQIADASVQLQNAQATKAAYEANTSSLKANKTALEAEKKIYDDMNAKDSLSQMDVALMTLATQMSAAVSQMEAMGMPVDTSGFTFNYSVSDVLASKSNHEKYIAWVKQIMTAQAQMAGTKPDTSSVDQLSYDNIKQLSDIVNKRLPQIESELSGIDAEIATSQMILDQVTSQMKGLDKQQAKLVAGGYAAAAGFGSGQAQLASAKQKIEDGKTSIKDAKKQFKDAKKAALDNANIDALMNIEALSGIIYAQNFAMPAGYIDDENDGQWLVEVGDTFNDETEINDLVLTEIKDIGEIKVSDVADVVKIDNADETYAKMNGNDAVILAIYKSSTSGTSEVTKSLEKSIEELGVKFPGLALTPIMNQGDYIDIIIKSILTSILLGAGLAIIVLALFLKDVRPTVVVAFSIPFSVLFALIIMYFTGITLNAMSLAGLCLGIGMLVDNSIVVMENVYRLRGKGVPAAKAAVQGAKQVAGPIVASTLTTICVFFPMVYTSGLVAQIMVPFAFTISYALVASLIVALTVVPTISSVMLKKTKERKSRVFDKIQNAYAASLKFCLKFKAIPLVIAVGLLAFCVIKTMGTGLVLMDDMKSNQISVSASLSEDIEKEDAYKIADDITERILSVDGVKAVGTMDGSVSAVAGISMSRGDTYLSYSFSVIADDNMTTTDDFTRIVDEITEKLDGIDAETTVSSSSLGELTSMMGSGVTINIYGEDSDELARIAKETGELLEGTEGLTNVDNGLSDDTMKLHVVVDRAKAAAKNLTTAQIYQEIQKKLSTSKKAITMTVDSNNIDVNIIDETDPLTYENLMELEYIITETNDDDEKEDVTYHLSDFATLEESPTMERITRMNQANYISVNAEVEEGYNATLISRNLDSELEKIELPAGYRFDIAGEFDEVMSMVEQMLLAILLGAVLVYLIMVAQFQSMLSPFIILFTVPLAFTGGMLGLMAFGMDLSALSLMGFMILMGTVVNNGIVFVDYTNKLQIGGIEKKEALILAGKTRMRPILMTAMTTILSMSVMVFSRDAGNAMQKSMAVVVTFGLIYSTLMTLYVVPVMYDIFYRKKPRVIDVGKDTDEEYDEAQELLEELQKQ